MLKKKDNVAEMLFTDIQSKLRVVMLVTGLQNTETRYM